ncbi:MAG: FAD/NAD(P)-binding protein [Chamaesiphon sp.]|nr:FAD/NAD(P)-binding protein [Chamaesiphon sp.]
MQNSTLKQSVDSPADAQSAYDLAIIGAGISSAYTLINYISLLEQQSNPRSMKIAVVERTGEFWAGVAYGDRTGYNSLLITSLREFLPQQLEREHFVAWLDRHRDWIFNLPEHQQGELSRKWLQTHAQELEQGSWDDLFLPRYTFGLYIQQQLTNVLDRAIAEGLIELDLLTAEVTDIERSADIYRLEIDRANEDPTAFDTKKVILAIGSPPNGSFDNSQSSLASDGVCDIQDIYVPSIEFNIQRICRSLQDSDSNRRQVLIIGSNASTLEIIYGLNNSQVAKNLISKFLILSPNAAFPSRISDRVVEFDYQPQHLVSLVQSPQSFTAAQILAAVEQDIAQAQSDRINIADTHPQISAMLIKAIDRLSLDEQHKFVDKYSVEIGKLQRRAGGEYLDVVDDLITQGKLEFIKGKLIKYRSQADGGVGCEYLEGENRVPKILTAPIGVVINCAGFQGVKRSSSPLMQNLINSGICVPNESDRGFLIDENFETSKNFYLMGPLVAGNINSNLKVWHAESCQRIISFSKHLAAALIRD